MQRVDNDPTDLFENGNPSTGVQGTRVMAEWLNAIQEELCFVIEESGLTLDPADDTQLLEALGLDFTDIPSGEKILFYKNTAVVGYSLLNTLDNKVVYVTKGSVAGGQAGGTVHSTGSWTISGISVNNHTLTTSQMPSHTHSITLGDGVGTPNNKIEESEYVGVTGTGATNSAGSGGSHPHGITIGSIWRPAAYNFTMQQRS